MSSNSSGNNSGIGPATLRPRAVQPIRVVNYAVNGLGLGHLTRLIAINRQLRRLARLLGERTEITFVTSSEGDGLAFQHGFASFHIPSKTAAATCDLDPRRYRKLARQWLWNALSLCSPDLLIVDTFPGGSFGELYDVLDLGQRNAFVYREVRETAASTAAFQSALNQYDLLVLPREFGENRSPVPATMRDRTTYTEQILIRSSQEVHTRARAREILGLDPHRAAVYVSTGGGGDVASEAVLSVVVEAARSLPDLQFVVGAGLLYRGEEPAAPNVNWTRRPLMLELFCAFDAAFTSGGFNSVWELMHCGIPAVFAPQPRAFDDQEKRVERCVSAGAGVALDELTPRSVAAAIQLILGQPVHDERSAAARRLVPRNCAVDAAEAVLSLVLPDHLVEAAGDLLDDALLWQAHLDGFEETELLDIAARLWRIQRARDGVEETEPLEASYLALQKARAEGITGRQLTQAVRVQREPAPFQMLLERAFELLRFPTSNQTRDPTTEVTT